MATKKRATAVAAQVALVCAGSGLSAAGAQAQGAAPERIEVTGTLIKRTDRETPSVVQTITREDIRRSGYTTVEELLRANAAVDSAGSIQDGTASGFVNGLATLSLRGFGAQGTLVLINGRRIAPAANVDVNFGRGTLINVNTIPKGTIERVEVLKDGASAQYGSDAMAGVINYVLRKNYQGFGLDAGYGASDQGAGKNHNASFSFGFGDFDRSGFNLIGGLEMSKRDRVMANELKDRGRLALSNVYRNLNGETSRFSPDSAASPWANYYRVPPSLTGTTTLDGRAVANNDVNGVNYLGTFPGCPTELTVGQGVPTRPGGFTATQASLRTGVCRFNLDEATEVISEQERLSGSLRASFKLGRDFTAYADLMIGKTTSEALSPPRPLTATVLASQQVPNIIITPKLDGTLAQQGALILPANHPDNPTRGTTNAQPVQLLYRFHDIPALDINEQQATRLSFGVEGSWGAWDLDTALLHSRQENQRQQTGRLRSSLLNASLAAGTYRFNGTANTDAAKASVASTALNEGESSITSFDVRASRELFKMGGGAAALALGVEARRESFDSGADANYLAGDYIGLVANLASGKRSAYAGFGELSLPLRKNLELQAALRFEKYSDFGNATTGKLGFKWAPMPSLLVLRGTATTGFRAPAISQVGNSSTVSFNSTQERRYFDPIRCNASNPANPLSLADPPNLRDCNVLNFTSGVPIANRPGNLPTLISANPNLKPETGKSATVGLVFSPTADADVALSYWYFERNKEIRLQRGQDILDAYLANPATNGAPIVRDPNPATWIPGVPNSGPILAAIRRYDNFNYSKTAGFDIDANLRVRTATLGRFTFSLNGVVTRRFQEQILTGGEVRDLLGTSTSEVPRGKGSVRVMWDYKGWNSWVRFNQTSHLSRIGITPGCETSTTAANVARREFGSCYVGGEEIFDLGISYSGIKNLTLSASVLNAKNDYNRSTDVPQVFTYWDQGTPAQVGRRFTLAASYQFE